MRKFWQGALGAALALTVGASTAFAQQWTDVSAGTTNAGNNDVKVTIDAPATITAGTASTANDATYSITDNANSELEVGETLTISSTAAGIASLKFLGTANGVLTITSTGKIELVGGTTAATALLDFAGSTNATHTNAGEINVTKGTINFGAAATLTNTGTISMDADSVFTGATALIDNTGGTVALDGAIAQASATALMTAMVAGGTNDIGTLNITGALTNNFTNASMTAGTISVANQASAAAGNVGGAAFLGTIELNGGTFTGTFTTKASGAAYDATTDGTLKIVDGTNDLSGATTTAIGMLDIAAGTNTFGAVTATAVEASGTNAFTGAVTVTDYVDVLAGSSTFNGAITALSVNVGDGLTVTLDTAASNITTAVDFFTVGAGSTLVVDGFAKTFINTGSTPDLGGLKLGATSTLTFVGAGVVTLDSTAGLHVATGTQIDVTAATTGTSIVTGLVANSNFFVDDTVVATDAEIKAWFDAFDGDSTSTVVTSTGGTTTASSVDLEYAGGSVTLTSTSTPTATTVSEGVAAVMAQNGAADSFALATDSYTTAIGDIGDAIAGDADLSDGIATSGVLPNTDGQTGNTTGNINMNNLANVAGYAGQFNVTSVGAGKLFSSTVAHTAGETLAAPVGTGLGFARTAVNNIGGRVANRNVARANAGAGFASVPVSAADCALNNIWVSAFGLWEDAGTRNGNRGYDVDTYGVMLGYDRVIGSFTVGGAFGYSYGEFEDKNVWKDNSDIDTWNFNLYGTYNHCSGFFATVLAGYTYTDFGMDQRINVLTREKYDFDTDTWNAGLTLGYDWDVASSGFILTPTVGAHYYNTKAGKFKTTYLQTMGDMKQDTWLLPVEIAGRYAWGLSTGGTFSLTGKVGYIYSTDPDGADASFTFRGVTNSPVVKSSARDESRHTFTAGLGAKYETTRYDFGLGYDYAHRSDYDAHRVNALFGIKF